MAKPLESEWQLDGAPLAREEFIRAFQDFDYYMSNCQQIVDKRRRLVHMKLNAFQKSIFSQIVPLLEPETRLDKRLNLVVCKPRQCGMTTGMIAFINWFLSCVEGIDNFSFIHILPATDTITKLYEQKVKPIITGVRPDIMATIEKGASMSSSIRLYYKDIMGVRRNNYYDLVSANASSLRSGTANALMFDECSFYRRPEELEDAVSPMLPAYGFSLVIFASTFDDRQSEYFRKKILTAQSGAEDWALIFAPWYHVYPEEPQGIALDSLSLTDYDQQIIMPALAKDGIPSDLWGDAIDWYHRASLVTSNMKKEYPTTLEEVLAIGEDKSVFTQESLAKQEKNIIPDRPYRLVTDTLTGKAELQQDETGPFNVYVPPRPGRKYVLCCDPIASTSNESDYYAASVFDASNNEQVATLYIRDLPVEDLAELTVGLATIYNRAVILPETNLAQGLVACIRAKGYYNFFYIDKAHQSRKEPGIRTTVSSKPAMIDKLQLLLDGERITVHSAETLRQLKTYKKITKNRSGGSSVSFSAPKGDHDDMVIPLLLFAGSKTDRELAGKISQGFTIL